jgi:hypothetical protein
MDPTLLIVLAGAAAAGFAQGVSGFAFSLVALSIWAWAVEPQLAAPMSVFGALMGQLIALPWVWRGFDLKKLLPLVIGGLAGVPLGAFLLQWLDPTLFKFGLGVFLLFYCPLMLLLPADYKWPHGGRLADGASGFAGGVDHPARLGQGHPARRPAGVQHRHARRNADGLCGIGGNHARSVVHVRLDDPGAGDSGGTGRAAVQPTGCPGLSAPDSVPAAGLGRDPDLG